MGIVRSLKEGPDYSPAWRYAVVQEYLGEIASDKNPAAKLQEILFRERDVFVRQLLRHRYNGCSASEPAFKYAIGCHARNRETGIASQIRAMLIADRTPTEIAEEIGTSTWNVVSFAKTFFDIRNYLDNEGFLRRVCFGEPAAEMTPAEGARERRWLSAAFHRGWEGVEQVVLRRPPHTPEAVEKVTRQLEAALAARALEYVEGLEADGVPPCEADLKRFNASRATAVRQPEARISEGSTMNAFLGSIHGVLLAQAATSDHPVLKEVWSQHQAGQTAPPQAPIRRRKRFSVTGD